MKGYFLGLLIAGVMVGSAHAQTTTIKIGTAAPLTGAGANYGKDMELGVRLAVAEANKQGIKIAGKSVTFNLIEADDANDPRVAVQIAQSLIDDGVVGVVGHYGSGTSIPAAPLYGNAGIPMITPSATNPTVTQVGKNNVFRVIGTDRENSGYAGTYAVTHDKAQRIAVMDDRTAFGQGQISEFVKAVKAAGGTVVDEEFTNDKAFDFRAQLTHIQGQRADLLYFGGLGDQAALVLRQLRQLNSKATFVGGGSLVSDSFLKTAGKDAEGAYGWRYGVPLDKMPQGQAFSTKFKQAYGTDVLVYAPFGYDAAWALIKAMQAANSTDPKVFMASLKTLKFDGVTGTIAFDTQGNLLKPSATLYQEKNGKWVALNTVQ